MDQLRQRDDALCLVDGRGRVKLVYDQMDERQLMAWLGVHVLDTQFAPTLLQSASDVERAAFKAICWRWKSTRAKWVWFAQRWSSLSHQRGFLVTEIGSVYSIEVPYLKYPTIHRTSNGGVFVSKGLNALSHDEFVVKTGFTLTEVLDSVANGLKDHLDRARRVIAAKVVSASASVATPDGVTTKTIYGLEDVPCEQWQLPAGWTFLGIASSAKVSNK